MNIYAARFNGHRPGGIVNQNYRTFCYGYGYDAAEAELCSRFERVTRLVLMRCPIVTVGACKPGDRIYRVEDGKLIGGTQPRQSGYLVCEDCEIIGRVTCRDDSGTKVKVAPSLQCIVRPQDF